MGCGTSKISPEAGGSGDSKIGLKNSHPEEENRTIKSNGFLNKDSHENFDLKPKTNDSNTNVADCSSNTPNKHLEAPPALDAAGKEGDPRAQNNKATASEGQLDGQCVTEKKDAADITQLDEQQIKRETWYPQARTCDCCKGFIYGCTAAACESAGECSCTTLLTSPNTTTTTQEAEVKASEGPAPSRAEQAEGPGEEELKTRCAQCGEWEIECETFRQDTDMEMYCLLCWEDYYGMDVPTLVPIKVEKHISRADLRTAWQNFWKTQKEVEESRSGQVAAAAGREEEEKVAVAEATREVWEDEDEEEIQIDLKVLCSSRVVGQSGRRSAFDKFSFEGAELAGGRYTVGGKIGQGNFSISHRAWDSTAGVERCAKFENKCTLQQALDKIMIHKRLDKVDINGNFFPRLVDSFFAHERWVFIEELVDGQHLWKVVENHPTYFQDIHRLRNLAQQMLSSLAMLRKAKVIHCDVKPDNIMMCTRRRRRKHPTTSEEDKREQEEEDEDEESTSEPDQFVLLDFGCAHLDGVDPQFALKEDGAGHTGHASMEMLLRKNVDCKNDVWALGVSLCELYTGKSIWVNGDMEPEVLAKLLGLVGFPKGVPYKEYTDAGFPYEYMLDPSGFPVRESKSHTSELEVLRPCTDEVNWGLPFFLGTKDDDLLAFICSLLEIDPRKRPTPEEALNHPFLNTNKELR